MNLSDLTKEKKQYLILGVVGAVAIIATIAIGVSFSISSMATSKDELAELKNKIDRAERTLAGVGKTRDGLEETIVRLKSHLDFIPPEQNYYSWATEIVYSKGRNAGLEIESVDELRVSGGKNTIPKDPVYFETYSLRITARGGYAQMKAFLLDVEANHPLVRFSGLDISMSSNPEQHDIQLVIQWPFKLNRIAKLWEGQPVRKKTMVATAQPSSTPARPVPVVEKPGPVVVQAKPAPAPKPVPVAPVPVVEKPAAVVVQAKPAPAPKSAPVVEKPAPVVVQAKSAPAPKPESVDPVPVVEKPAPVVVQAKPVPTLKAVPVAPVPVIEKPAPVVVQAKPVPTPKAVPVAPVPVVEKPAPVVVQAKPVPTPKAVPVAPVPVVEKPAPVVVQAKPAPVVKKTEPVVVESGPAPASKPKEVSKQESLLVSVDQPAEKKEPSEQEANDPEAVLEENDMSALLASLSSRGSDDLEPVPVDEPIVVEDDLAAFVQELAENKPDQTVPAPAPVEISAPPVAVTVVNEPVRYVSSSKSAKILEEILTKDKPKANASLGSFLDGLVEDINDKR